jgi:hypothetical protein
MKKDRMKDLFLAQLRKVPIVEVACQQVGIARSTAYKWRDEDSEFRKAMEEALTEGEAMLNDLGENQLYSLMLEKHYPSIAFWLRHRNPKFKDKLEITTRTQEEKEKITAEQNAIVEGGLAMLELPDENETGGKESNKS